MLRKFVNIVLRREYLGFVLGVACTIAVWQLGPGAWSALVVVGIVFVGIPIARRYGTC